MTTQADLNAYVQQLQGLGTGQVMWMNGVPMRYTAQGMMPDPQWTQMNDALDSRPGGDGHNTPVNWQQQIQNVGGAISLNQAQQNAGYPGSTPGQRSGVPGGGGGGTPGGAIVSETGLGGVGERGLLGGMPSDPNRSMGPSRMPFQVPPRGMGPGMVGNPGYNPGATPPGGGNPPGGTTPPGGGITPPGGGNPPGGGITPPGGGNPPGTGGPPGGFPPNPIAPGLLGTAPRQWTGSPWQAGPNSAFSGSFFPAFGVQGVANYQYPAQPGGFVPRTPGTGGFNPTGGNPPGGNNPGNGNPPGYDPVNGSQQSANVSSNTGFTPRNLVNYAAGGVQLPYRNQFEQYTQSLAMAQPWMPTYNGRGQSRGQPQGGMPQGGYGGLGALLGSLLGGRGNG